MLHLRSIRVAQRTAVLLRSCCIPIALVLAPVGVVRAQRSDTIVKQATRPAHAGMATLVAEISIGVLDGADEYMFGDVSELAVGADGSIYVYDRQVPALRQYDASGRFVRNIGRRGQGPGEYLNGGGLAIGRDGRIYLWDTGNWRINVYSPAGESVGQLPTPSGAAGNFSFSTQRGLTIDTAGLLYFRRPLQMHGQSGERRDQYVRLRVDGAVVDSIDVPVLPLTQRMLTAVSPAGNARSEGPVPFTPQPAWALSPHGYFVTGFPARYAVDLRIPAGTGAWKEGQPVISLRRSMTPLPIDARERDAARQRMENQMRGVDPNWKWSGPDLPRVWPFFTSLRVGADGRVWVPLINENVPRRSGAVSLGGGGAAPARPAETMRDTPRPALYDVWEPDGTYLGQVQIPPRVITLFRRADHLWGLAFDDDDVVTVKRYRIVWR